MFPTIAPYRLHEDIHLGQEIRVLGQRVWTVGGKWRTHSGVSPVVQITLQRSNGKILYASSRSVHFNRTKYVTQIAMNRVSVTACHGGELIKYELKAESLDGLTTRFNVFTPFQSTGNEDRVGEKNICLYWLSGLTCNEDNFAQKAGAFGYAKQHGMIIVMPDTSPSKRKRKRQELRVIKKIECSIKLCYRGSECAWRE